MSVTTQLPGVIAAYHQAVNDGDLEAAVATFADDAYINDNRREMWGRDAIRAFIAQEIVGDKVTMEVTEVLDHRGGTVLRAAYDGVFDKTNLPDPLILTHYFSVRDDRIVALVIIFNQPSPY